MKFDRHERRKANWLDAYPTFRHKYFNQCVACQDFGYDPAKAQKNLRIGFKSNLRKYFHPLELNEFGLCPTCSAQNPDLSTPENDSP